MTWIELSTLEWGNWNHGWILADFLDEQFMTSFNLNEDAMSLDAFFGQLGLMSI